MNCFCGFAGNCFWLTELRFNESSQQYCNQVELSSRKALSLKKKKTHVSANMSKKNGVCSSENLFIFCLLEKDKKKKMFIGT